jgi:ketosteroid isomerase-like protein
VSNADNLEIAKRYLSRLAAGAGPDDLDLFFCPDVIQEEFPNRLLPNGATRNLEALKESCARGTALMKAQTFEVVNAIAGDDQVAMEVIWTGTVREAAGPFAAGQLLKARFALFLTFREGRIVRQRNYDCFDPW